MNIIYKIQLLPWILLIPTLFAPVASIEYQTQHHLAVVALFLSLAGTLQQKYCYALRYASLIALWIFVAWSLPLEPLFTTLLLTLSLSIPYLQSFAYKEKNIHTPVIQAISSLSITVLVAILWSRAFDPYILQLTLLFLLICSIENQKKIYRVTFICATGLMSLAFAFKWQQNVINATGLFISLYLAILSLQKIRLLLKEQPMDLHFKNPSVVIVGYFAVLGFLGSSLLHLPVLQNDNTVLYGWSHHLFTAVSAVSVTGLSVLNITETYNIFGQVLILILIQLGGLGMISMSAWTVFIFQNQRLSLEHEKTLKRISTSQWGDSVYEVIKKITLYVFFCEGFGFLIFLGWFFYHDHSFSSSCWNAVFLSISSFCNAGFTLQNQSLSQFQQNPWILGTVSTLILAGGFSPLMVLQLPYKIRHGRLDLTDRMVLYTTGSLLFTSFLSFLFIERFHAFAQLDTSSQILNAWFHAVSLRTAGFYSIPFEDMSPLTHSMSIFMMFIGGNPGGTAGGIKTTTFAVLCCVVLSTLQGRKRVVLHSRLIPPEAVLKAMTVFLLGTFMVIISFTLILLSQQTDIEVGLFEVVSALSTVGLSIGLSDSLNDLGRLIISGCMLAGRVGPLTFMLFLIHHDREERWRYPREEIDIS